MFHMLRKFAAVFLSVAFALMAGGCGNIAVHEELRGRGREPIVIRIAWWGGEERHTVTEQVLALYSREHPEVTFEMQSYTWDDYFDILSRKAAQGDMPDLIQMDYQYITTYSENGSLADLMPFVEDGTIRTEDMEGAVLESGVIDGRMTGIVLGTGLICTVCNPQVFEEAGLPLPAEDWTWEDFADICIRIKEKTGKYGAAMTPILDMNLYHYWVRQHGEELFSPDGDSLGYEEDSIYVEYVKMFKGLIDAGAVPDSDSWAAINVRGAELLPVVTGDCGMIQEWNNFPVRMSYVNEGLKLVTLPLLSADEGNIQEEIRESGQSNAPERGQGHNPESGQSNAPESSQGHNPESGRSADQGRGYALWLKPGMFFSVAETSSVKRECAQFIDWFLHSEEANALLGGERGVPVSRKIRDSMSDDETLPEALREMLCFSEEAMSLCGDTPPPEPSGIDGINAVFAETANAYFYGMISAEEAAEEFRRRTNEILQSNY